MVNSNLKPGFVYHSQFSRNLKSIIKNSKNTPKTVFLIFDFKFLKTLLNFNIFGIILYIPRKFWPCLLKLKNKFWPKNGIISLKFSTDYYLRFSMLNYFNKNFLQILVMKHHLKLLYIADLLNPIVTVVCLRTNLK